MQFSIYCGMQPCGFASTEAAINAPTVGSISGIRHALIQDTALPPRTCGSPAYIGEKRQLQEGRTVGATGSQTHSVFSGQRSWWSASTSSQGFEIKSNEMQAAAIVRRLPNFRP